MRKRKRAHRGLGAVVDGTTYSDATPSAVVQILEQARQTRSRICIVYGDPNTGKPWSGQRWCGRVGRSTGSMKVPLLVPTVRSFGGDAILDDKIVRITQPGTKRVLYSADRPKQATLLGRRK